MVRKWHNIIPSRSQEDGSVARPQSPQPWPARVSATPPSANGLRWGHRLVVISVPLTPDSKFSPSHFLCVVYFQTLIQSRRLFFKSFHLPMLSRFFFPFFCNHLTFSFSRSRTFSSSGISLAMGIIFHSLSTNTLLRGGNCSKPPTVPASTMTVFPSLIEDPSSVGGRIYLGGYQRL